MNRWSPKYPSRIVILAIGLLLIFFTTEVLGAPKMWVERQSANFGRVARGTTVSESFLIRNLGDETLVIEDAQVSMPGMAIQVRQSLEPAEEAELVVKWDTSNISQQVEGAVRLKLNDPVQPRILLSLSGTVFSPVDVLPYPLVMLSSFEGEQATRTLEILNNQESPLHIYRLEPQGDAFIAEVVPIEEGQRYELHVTVKESTPVGRYEQFLVVHTNSPKRPKLGIQVRILVKPDVYVNVDAVNFGQVGMTSLRSNATELEMLTQSIIISRRDGVMSITGFESEIPFLTFSATPSQPSQRVRIDLGLDPDGLTPGFFSGSIKVRTNVRKHSELEIPVRIQVVE